jgi:hypothetical protein
MGFASMVLLCEAVLEMISAIIPLLVGLSGMDMVFLVIRMIPPINDITV